MRLILIITLLSIVNVNLLACQCVVSSLREAQQRSYEDSQLIFVGDVLIADQKTGTYQIKIVEIFKGDIKTTTITGKLFTSCSGFPDKGRWIIYAESVNRGVIDFSTCGLSRSFDAPQNIWMKEYEVPPPPTKKYETDSKYSIQANIDFQRAMLQLETKALTDLEVEIEELRKRK